MKNLRRSFPLLLTSVVALAACSQGKPMAAANNVPPPEPVSWQESENEESKKGTMALMPMGDEQAGMYTRLARVEADVASLKQSMADIQPALEKLPALQEKLHELVNELQKIDDRIATTKSYVDSAPLPMMEEPAPRASDSSKTSMIRPVEKPLSHGLLKPAPALGLKAEMPKADIMEESMMKPPPAKPDTKASMTSLPPKMQASAQKMVDETATAAAAIKPAAATSSPAPTPSAVAAKTDVTAVRFGQHDDKTRLVLDLTKQADYSYDLDNAEKILILEVKGTAWSAPMVTDLSKSPLVAAYSVQSDTSGNQRMIVQLKQPVGVTAHALPPNGDKGNRIILDLAKAG